MLNCAHRDIKLDNFLITNNDGFFVKFADFGISDIYDDCVGNYVIGGT